MTSTLVSEKYTLQLALVIEVGALDVINQPGTIFFYQHNKTQGR